jgi:hypothetical protein
MTLKLLKYDLRSLFKRFALLWPAALVLALVLGLSFNLEPLRVHGMMYFTMVLLFGGVMAAMGVVAVIFIVNRFSAGLLKDEGYLMFTLPVTGAQLICSKLLTAMAAVIISALVGLGSFILLGATFTFYLEDFFRMAQWLLEKLVQLDAETWLLLAEGLLLGLAALAAQILLIYMCIAIGHLAPGHRSLAAVGAWLVLSAAERHVLSGVDGLLNRMDLSLAGLFSGLPGEPAVTLALTICAHLALSAIYFAVTNYILTRRLNLE